MSIVKEGNATRYSVKCTETEPNSPLKCKTYCFLGSSVTFGYASKRESMVDFIAKRNGCNCIKEAVSGTTLADLKRNSYVRRLKKLDSSLKLDGFICQLSTNDVRLKNKGVVSEGYALEKFDTQTTYGAIEYIIAYAKKTWNCPIYFYTNAYYPNEGYREMVDTMAAIAKKWDIVLIDLFRDEAFNAISEEQRKLFMKDDVHPTRAGYRYWWTPKFEEYLK